MEISAFVSLVCELLGGIGLFLLGMKCLSDGMQAVAGSSLRRWIAAVTRNRFLALFVGVGVTCVVQSSTIVTVMTVGFVNSGIMTLRQAIGVIMGANIGTTLTGWILVLNIGKYGAAIVGVACFVYLFSKSDRWRYWGMAALGIGLVFFGFEIMKDACGIIKENPSFVQWFQQFQADSFIGVLKCAMVGCFLTVLIQSSTATLGITISLAFQGVISYETAAALVLGENIGTTITAFIASLGATANARRAALFHICFNLIGVCWVMLIFQWYIQGIQALVGGNVNEAVIVDDQTIYPRTTAAIAAAHSLFSILNTMLFLPFVPLCEAILNRVIRARQIKERAQLTDLDTRLTETPILAIQQSRNEIEKMGDGCEKMLAWLGDLREQDTPDKDMGDRLKEREQIFDSVQEEVAVFVTDLLSNSLPHSVAAEARRQLSLADEFESVSDYLVSLDKFDRKLRRDGFRFTDSQRQDLRTLNERTLTYVRMVNESLLKGNRHVVRDTDAISKRIKSDIKQLRRKHLEDLSSGTIPPQVSVAFLAALNAYARVRDHLENIAETIASES